MKPATTTVRGTATLCTVTDMAPMLSDAVARAKVQSGLPATCSPEELAEAAARFEASLDEAWTAEVDQAKAELARDLAPGITLDALKVERSGLLVTSITTFGFDDVKKLKDLAFKRTDAPQTEALRPFQSLSVRTEKSELSLEAKLPTFPSAANASPEMLAKNRIRLELRFDAKVLSHDATAVNGDVLAWEHPLSRLSDPARPATVRVKLALGR